VLVREGERVRHTHTNERETYHTDNPPLQSPVAKFLSSSVLAPNVEHLMLCLCSRVRGRKRRRRSGERREGGREGGGVRGRW
jgi:hypothetical protein